MKKYILIIAIALQAAALAACGSAKKAVNPDSTTVTTTPAAPGSDSKRAQQIASTFGAWQSMQCNGTLSLGGKKSISSSINVRMQRDKFVSISLRPILGIEVGRMVFTGDSVYIVDKVHRQYIAENVDVFINGLPANVSTLQDIFLGRAFTLEGGTFNQSNTKNAVASVNNNVVTLTPVKTVKGFVYDFKFDDKNLIKALTVTPEGAKETTYQVDYADVRKTVAGNVAHSLSIEGTMKGNALKLKLSYNNISWNQNVTADTSIPSGYKRMTADKLDSLLGGGDDEKQK